MENNGCLIRITFMQFNTSAVIWHQNFMHKFAKILQLLKSPRPPTGASPLDPTGGLPSPRPPGRGPPFVKS